MKLYRKDISREYGVDLRTVDRWKADGTLPRPRRMKRPYWTPEQIARAEAINLKRWTEREQAKARKSARLRKHRLTVRITTGQTIPNQFSLNLNANC